MVRIFFNCNMFDLILVLLLCHFCMSYLPHFQSSTEMGHVILLHCVMLFGATLPVLAGSGAYVYVLFFYIVAFFYNFCKLFIQIYCVLIIYIFFFYKLCCITYQKWGILSQEVGHKMESYGCTYFSYLLWGHLFLFFCHIHTGITFRCITYNHAILDMVFDPGSDIMGATGATHGCSMFVYLYGLAVILSVYLSCDYVWGSVHQFLREPLCTLRLHGSCTEYVTVSLCYILLYLLCMTVLSWLFYVFN